MANVNGTDPHDSFEEILAESTRRRDTLWGTPDERDSPERLGLVGAGLMGTSIAAAAIDGGMDVVLVDSESLAREAANERVASELVTGYGRDPEEAALWVKEKLKVRESLEGLAECDVVLESISESPEAKKGLFDAIRPSLSEGTILATNTSTIPLRGMIEAVPHPERFCGIHFCHPVAKRRFIEIIASETTSKATVATALAFARRLKRFAIVVGDAAGFVVNRMLSPCLIAAFEMLLDGVSPERIDALALDYGLDKGPLALADEIGIDVLLHGALVLRDAFPERFTGSAVPIALVKAKRLGTKAGAGVYRYDADGTRRVDPTLDEALARYRRRRPTQDYTDRQIIDTLFKSLAEESTAILEEDVAIWPGDIAAACVLGLGFPKEIAKTFGL